ncbi:MAG: 50S ribosomal protein L3 N(5)-glutamine methyltransferase [Gammaproteobacteria bacterium]|nr:50S ribosomal protein L3 N(5)-glutamine methyltransferase [Gammaproteobacteria bacterium]
MNQHHYEEFMDELDTIRDILRWTVTQFETSELFYGHGTDNAWDEAIALLQFYLKFPIQQLHLVFDARLTDSEKEEIYQLLDKRINTRMPLPYITNEAWFKDMDFYVDKRVLIPRSPIAELIKQDFQPWLNLALTDLRILEIGTGSGCIACAIANQFIDQNSLVESGINLMIDATDISTDALEVAKINISDYGYTDTINLIHSDLFDNIPKEKKYDLIISNPPYVDAAAMKLLPEEYSHEPRSALASGIDGLNCVKKILQHAAEYLTDSGIIIIEVGASQSNLEKAYSQLSFIWLDFTHGGSGVFVLTRQQLIEFQYLLNN